MDRPRLLFENFRITPAHVHVIDNKGNVVRVGQNGKPLEGEPELNMA